jgi:hypothetical protein
MTQKALMIAGPLSEADLAELMTAIRRIEQRDPQSTYRALIIDLEREPSIEEMEEHLEAIFPRVPGKEAYVWTKRR